MKEYQLRIRKHIGIIGRFTPYDLMRLSGVSLELVVEVIREIMKEGYLVLSEITGNSDQEFCLVSDSVVRLRFCVENQVAAETLELKEGLKFKFQLYGAERVRQILSELLEELDSMEE